MVLLYKRLNQKLSPELIIAKVKPRTYNCVNFLLDKGGCEVIEGRVVKK